ncbi:MAG: hypothetical protein COV72_09190 [Candidatus Omnitrophica bacterium CG11_big_fil_rev_8_21_14_0_20_42_13]|uniref:UDP-N-acetylmuramoyl-tripeptide--D-alanyl-D-alanine ligase n=1 Tax=Candidatus Ghiorseimicrobium undicola TaxID=1974746 RepID=A0A2H0LVA6_9BACT|nr:MAG: hypothetical protein COV72_09190 [Candidatus Omnitrophica bacterium CG11_big_fil_rev_8_21_14_0_20_42_13]
MKSRYLLNNAEAKRRLPKDGLPPLGFSVEEVIKATGGKLISGEANIFALHVSSDTRSIKEGELFISIRGKKFDGHGFIADAIKKGARIIIVDNKFRFSVRNGYLRISGSKTACDCGKVSFVMVEDTVKALMDIAQFHRARLIHIPIIGVTGSCGKTTTKDMIYELLSTKYNVLKNEGTFNNFIGVSHTILKLNKGIDMAVLEMGTSSPGEIKKLSNVIRPNVGVITNIGPSHLAFFKTLNNILGEKYELVNNLQSPRLAILNTDDVLINNRAKNEEKALIFTVGINDKNYFSSAQTFSKRRPGLEKRDFSASNVRIKSGVIDFTLNNKQQLRINMLGLHNIYNALSAVACAVVFGISPRQIKKRMPDFILPSTRINFKRIKGYNIIDDTYNSNPLSLEWAIDALKNFSIKGKKIFVMGDMLELGEKSILLHRQMAKKITESGVNTLITVGRFSTYTADAVSARQEGVKVYSCGSNLEARGILSGIIRSDDLILVKGSRAMQMEKIIEGL